MISMAGDRARRVRPLAAAVALALLVPTSAAGCSRLFGCAPAAPDDITVSDLAGAYTSSQGGRIELRADGTYRASDLPTLADGSADGEWTLDLDSETTEDMRLDDLQMWISGDREKPWLYQFDGDPDNCRLIEFHGVD
ncbi:hypothetical protein SAMN05421812_112176 [Asanoa hainanensis]|uniref:Lipoprotein n=1 Tax=Asanoa hainanensis TaxID=560556 RepID=A0A239P163_9ACTN|nr:hypothetical protein [Asanoa hainanensis]SNT60732.1 hypothetical protein SAMN05421812_112176 [Asanoa hainanensis]